MEGFGRFGLEHREGHRKLARYRLEAAQRRLIPRTPWRAQLARGLHRLAERLEPAPPAHNTPWKRSLG